MRNGLSHSECGKLGAAITKKIVASKKVEREHRYISNPKLCRGCGSPLPYQKRFNSFCCSSCFASVNNQKRAKKSADKSSECCRCGKETKAKQRKYCSIECGSKHKWELHKKEIEAAGGFPDTASETNQTLIRKYILDTQPNRCSLCGLDSWKGNPIPLIVDHTDGNASNNSLENLRLLCCNCDALQPTWKNRNRGNGRPLRRSRYTKGIFGNDKVNRNGA